jgi:hypothetical protein
LHLLREDSIDRAVEAIPDAQAIFGANIDKLRALGADGWQLDTLTPNRRKLLAGIGRRSTNQALQRTPPERCYPILLAFLAQATEEVTDEIVNLFDRALTNSYARARRELDEFRRTVARSTNEKVSCFVPWVESCWIPPFRTPTCARRSIVAFCQRRSWRPRSTMPIASCVRLTTITLTCSLTGTATSASSLRRC